MYNDNREYVAMRLENTVVRVKKKGLVRVLEVMELNNKLWTLVCEVDENGEDNYPLPLDELELSSPLLGNVDSLGFTYYVSRMPKRNDWRQGLRKDNLVYVYEGRQYGYNLPQLKILAVPVYDKYRPYKVGRAFSRNFSVDKEGCVWYKCREKVGRDVRGVPVLDEKYEWLKEALEDALKR